LQAGIDNQVNRAILNLKLDNQALRHGIAASRVSS
jgi:hypothetical protein